MGKLALLLALALSTVAIYHGSASGSGLSDAARQAGEQQRLVLARSAAKSGWARAKQQLVGSFAGGVVQGANGSATYRTQMDVTGNEVVVTSVGRVPVPGSSTPTTYTLTYRLRKAGGGLPTFATHAVAVNGNMDMSGNGAIVTPGVTGTAGDNLNIRVHANGNLHAGSASTIVQGFGSYTTSASGKLDNTFRPEGNTSGEPPLARADSVRIPRIVPAALVAAYGGSATVYPPVPGRYFAKELINKTLPGGARDNPRVYYIRGNANLVNLTIDGYAVFVADGRIEFSGTTKGTPDTRYPTESAIAFMTPGEITMGGGTNVYGSLFATSGLRYNGNVDIWGNLLIGGDFSHGGGATVHYIPPAPGLFKPWLSDPALTLLAFREQ